MTLAEKIGILNPDAIIALSRNGEVFWIGKAKYVFGAVTLQAWRSTDITVKVCS